MTAGMTFEEVRLKSGIHLRDGEQCEPGAPAMVMLHGFNDSWFSFSPAFSMPPEVKVIAAGKAKQDETVPIEFSPRSRK
jgi:hypothetical protein